MERAPIQMYLTALGFFSSRYGKESPSNVGAINHKLAQATPARYLLSGEFAMKIKYIAVIPTTYEPVINIVWKIRYSFSDILERFILYLASNT